MATSDETGNTEPRRSAEDYCKAIKHAERYFEQWHKVCDRVDTALSSLERLAKGGGDREMQVFWANWEVMTNQVYSRPPIPVVTQRHTTSELRRQTAMTLERCAVTAFDDMDLDYTLRLVRDDMIAASRGVAWVSYRAKGETREDFIESVAIDHLDRQCFIHEPARSWPEVGWVAKLDWLTKQQLRKRFPSAPIDRMHFVKQEDDIGGEVMKAAVYEVWDKVENTVVWVHEGYLEEVLDEKEPWLKLKGFFPCPRPAYAMLQRRTLLPVPEYVYIRDQLEEINLLTARISALTESLRLKGFIPSGTDDIGQAVEAALREVDDRAVMVPVANFGAFGGSSLKDSIVWLPVVEVANTIMTLIEIRRQTIDDLYQVSGITDIQRGDSDPNETLGAQQLKAANSAGRIRSKQAEMVRFARDLIVIEAEIISEEFNVDTIAVMSQTDLPRRAEIQQQAAQMQQQMQQGQMQLQQMQAMAQDPQAQQMAQQQPEMAQQAQQMMQQAEQQMQEMQGQLEELMNTVTLDDVTDLLDNEKLRPFVLDVESDSTIQPDEQAEKQARAEFTAAIGGLLAQAVPAVQAVPELAPLIGETIRFNAAAFRQGRQLQDEVDEFVDKLKNGEIKVQSPDGGDGGAAAKAEVEQQKAQAQAQLDAQRLQMDQQRMQMEGQMAQQKAAIEQEQAQQKLAVERANAELDAESRRGEMMRDQQRFELERQTVDLTQKKIDAEIKRIEAQAKAAARKPELSHGSRD